MLFRSAIPNKPPTCSSRSWCNINRFRPPSHYNTSPKGYTVTKNTVTFKLTPMFSVNKPLQLRIASVGDHELIVRYTFPSEHLRFRVPTNTAFTSVTPQPVSVINSNANVATIKFGTMKVEVYRNASVVIDGDFCIGCTGQFLYREDVKGDSFAVGIDVEFPTLRLYGTGKNVKQPIPLTDKSSGAFTEPYHFYASGYTTFPVNSTHPQYGTLPAFMSHRSGRSIGVMYTNPADTFIDHEVHNDRSKLLITSEDGDISFAVFSKKNPADVIKSYYKLTGTSFMPPRFALGFQNSKWGYTSQSIVEKVDKEADENGFMYDIMWLDIEHTQRKRYFTWDLHSFPDPIKFQEQLKSKNRYLVTIQDCHIADHEGYYVHDEGKAGNYFIKKDKNGTDYLGACWALKSNWVDFLWEEARDWWAGLYSFDKYKYTTDIVYAWNDMNEPSEFDIEDLLVKKTAIHHGGVLHRNVHNLYGMLQQMSTQKGQLMRSNNKLRSFVLSRSYYFGSQKFGAMWTGDSGSTFEYMSSQIPQLVGLSMFGFLCGGDVGGFSSNPSNELMIRWYQAASLQPFFRQHASQTAKRREPWLFEKDVSDKLKFTVNLRYQMLPYWYTQWHLHINRLEPVLRSMYYEFPTENRLFENDHQYMIGQTYLASPVAVEGETEHTVQFPPGKWYDFFDSSKVYQGSTDVKIGVTLDSIPLFGRAGRIGTERIVSEGRKSGSESEKLDYLRIVIYDNDGSAEGDFYTDDGISVDNTDNHVYAHLKMSNYVFDYESSGDYMYGDFVNEVVLVTEKKVTKVTLLVEGNDEATLEFTQSNGRVIVTNVRNHFSSGWTHWSIRFD